MRVLFRCKSIAINFFADYLLKVSSALISFSLDSVAAVKAFGATAEKHGGTVHHVEMGIPENMMYGLEVQDLDGNCLEPSWMKMD